MKSLLRPTLLGIAAAATCAAFAAPAAAAVPTTHHHVVFAQTDDPSGNSVVVYDRSATGTLTLAHEYPTGGTGGQLTGSVVDHTASQGALAYDPNHSLVLVANAGSDSISVFSTHSDHLTRLQVLPSGGTFPVSIAVHGNLVYVLNARNGGRLQGYVITSGQLARVPGWNRALNLPSAAPEFVHTPGQVAFTPSGDRLVVTTKAATSSIETFALAASGMPATTPVVTADPGAVPFAVAWDAAGHLVVTEAATSAVATFALNANGTVSLLHRLTTGQAATCWIVGTGSKFYASNAGSADLTVVRDSGGALTSPGNVATSAGTVDATISSDGQFLYVQGGGAGTIDAFHIRRDASLVPLGTVTVPDAVGAEGIATT